MTIDPEWQPTSHAALTAGRLGWWHVFWRKALLVGHEPPELAPLIVDMPPAVRELALRLEDYRSQFAMVARTFGANYKGGYWMMYLVAPLAVFLSATSSVAPAFRPFLYGGELLLILSILVLFYVMRRGGWQERWIRSRRTAEHLRYLPMVAPFVRNPHANWFVDLAAHHGMRVISDDEVTRVCAWLGHNNATATLRIDNPAFCAGYVKYVDESLTRQIRYHSINADMERTLARRISVASSTFFAVTILCTALLFLENLTTSLGLSRYLSPLYLRLCATVLPALGAGLRGVLAQGESHRVAALSEGMAIRLTQLRDQLRALPSNAASPEALENLIWNAVQELLSEADTWMRLQESVPLSMAA